VRWWISGERFRVGLAVDRDAHERRARPGQALGLLDRRGHVLGVGRAHALHGNRSAAADLHARAEMARVSFRELVGSRRRP